MLDIIRLKKIQEQLERKEQEEFYNNLDSTIIQFAISDFFKSYFTEHKTRKETSQSARVLNNWEQEELIPKIDIHEGRSRRFTKVEAIWLDLITICREFGLSLEKIKLLRDKLFTPVVKNLTPFEYALMHSIIQEAIVLVMFDQGEIKLMPASSYSEYIKTGFLPAHLHFNLLSLAEIEFPNNNFKSLQKEAKSASLNEKELQLLYFLRTGDFDTIKIRMKEGEIYLLEGSRKISPNSKIIDVINRKQYQDIEIKTQNGVISHFIVTEKLKV